MIELTELEGKAALDFITANSATRAPLDIYVDELLGDDGNDGSILAPVRTLLKVDTMIPFWVDHRVTIHLNAQTYNAPSRGWWLSSRVLRGGYIEVLADEAWDAAVYTQIATGAAQAGTDATTVFHGQALTTNQWRGYTIEFTSGPAAGQRRTICWNTANELDPGIWFTNGGPVAGDTYRVFDTGGALIVGEAAGSFSTYNLSQAMEGSLPIDAAHYYQLPDGVLYGCVVWNGVAFSSNGGSATPQFGRGNHLLYGTRGIEQNCAHVSQGGKIWAGLGAGTTAFGVTAGLVAYRLFYGWGHSAADRGITQVAVDSEFVGVIARRGGGQTGILSMQPDGGGLVWIIAGTLTRYLGSLQDKGRIGVLRFSAGVFSGSDANAPRADFGASVFIDVLTIAPTGNIMFVLQNCVVDNMGAPIRMRGGTRMYLNGGGNCIIANAGGDVIDVSRGSEVFLHGSPANIGAGGGASDWRVDGGAFDPLVSLASAGDVVTGAQTSKVVRAA